MERYVAKLLFLMKSKEFLEELLTKETAEEAQAFFADNDIELTIDEVKEIGSAVDEALNNESEREQIEQMANGELSEEELENVAGGSAATIAIAIGCGVVGGGTIGVGGGLLYKHWDSVTNFFRRW